MIPPRAGHGRGFSAAQTRAARALLGWPVRLLASAAEVDPGRLRAYERGAIKFGDEESQRLGAAIRGAGVIPIVAESAGEGVRFVRPPLGPTVQEAPPKGRGRP